MNEEPGRGMLRALAAADAGAEARPEIEMNLRRAFRARQRKRVRRQGIMWAAAAAAIVLAMVFMNRKPPVLPQPSEVVTDFFPLMDPAPPFQRGRILRVEVPASAMKMVGLPVHEEHLNDPVEADVLVGEEGLPRAIRFVKLERQQTRN
jgi:hypothetical protein